MKYDEELIKQVLTDLSFDSTKVNDIIARLRSEAVVEGLEDDKQQEEKQLAKWEFAVVYLASDASHAELLEHTAAYVVQYNTNEMTHADVLPNIMAAVRECNGQRVASKSKKTRNNQIQKWSDGFGIPAKFFKQRSLKVKTPEPVMPLPFQHDRVPLALPDQSV